MDRIGIDVSHYQSSIDWQKVKTAGIEFAILKAMYESSKSPDEYFEINYKGCTDVGIARGVYNFIGSVSAANPVEDANAFLGILNNRELEYGIWLDIESKNLRALGSEKIEEVVFAEADIFEAAGYFVGVYCNLDWYKNVLTPGIKKRFKDKLWIARYPKNDTGEVKPTLNVKNVCEGSIGWQYTSKGKVKGISTNVDRDIFWGEVEELNAPVISDETEDREYLRSIAVMSAEKWLGLNEDDNSYLEILNVYNSYSPLPRGYAIKPGDAWCAAFASAVFISCGYDAIFPIECSCSQMINKAKDMGIWVEDDSYVPYLGDAVLYDWQDNGVGDNTGNPDHVGIIDYVNKQAGYMVVIEGNYDDCVKKRTINLDGKYIRGFVVPKFTNGGVIVEPISEKDIKTIAHEVIAGKWGNGEIRKQRLTEAGYNYDDVRKLVNEILNEKKYPGEFTNVEPQYINSSYAAYYVTTANLNLRNGAGTNKKSMVIMPKGTKVKCSGYYSVYNNVDWLLVETEVANKKYKGYCSSKYLKRLGGI